MGYKFNPFTGTFDIVGDGSGPSSADRVVSSKIAASPISALQVVYAVTSTTIAPINSNLDQAALGVAIQAAGAGDTLEVVEFGEVADLSFSFAANARLFFNALGAITTTAPATGFSTEIGHAMGPGKIFVNIKPQVALA